MHTILKNFIQRKTDCDNQTIEEIASYFTLIKTKRNQILLNFDQVANQYYFVNKGCIRIFTTTKDGLEISRYFAFEGTFVTALPSFIDQLPAEEYIQTIEKSELLCISRTDFYYLVNKIPSFAKIYTEILKLGFIVAQKRIYGFQGYNALDKVKWVIKNQPQLLLRVSNKIAASYLGITPSTLSRIKAQL